MDESYWWKFYWIVHGWNTFKTENIWDFNCSNKSILPISIFGFNNGWDQKKGFAKFNALKKGLSSENFEYWNLIL